MRVPLWHYTDSDTSFAFSSFELSTPASGTQEDVDPSTITPDLAVRLAEAAKGSIPKATLWAGPAHKPRAFPYPHPAIRPTKKLVRIPIQELSMYGDKLEEHYEQKASFERKFEKAKKCRNRSWGLVRHDEDYQNDFHTMAALEGIHGLIEGTWHLDPAPEDPKQTIVEVRKRIADALFFQYARRGRFGFEDMGRPIRFAGVEDQIPTWELVVKRMEEREKWEKNLAKDPERQKMERLVDVCMSRRANAAECDASKSLRRPYGRFQSHGLAHPVPRRVVGIQRKIMETRTAALAAQMDRRRYLDSKRKKAKSNRTIKKQRS